MKRFVLPILLAGALPAADSRIMPAMNAFTIASYKQLSRGDANLIASPFNIATVLSMALAGARGGTAEEIQSVLHVRYDPTYDAALGTLLDRPHQGRQHRRERTAHRQRTLGTEGTRHPAGLREHPRQQLPRPAHAARFRRQSRSRARPNQPLDRRAARKRRSKTCSRPAHSTRGPVLSSPAPSTFTANGRTRSSPRAPSPHPSLCRPAPARRPTS